MALQGPAQARQAPISSRVVQRGSFTSPVTLLTSVAIPKASLIQGYDVFAVPIPSGCKQFLRVYYTVANGPLTAGKFTAALVTGVMSYKHYPRAAVARV